MKNQATTVKELPSVLGGQPAGTVFHIEGYVDSAGVTRDLVVKTLGPDEYAKMKQQSLRILLDNPAPTLPGFPPVIVAQARDALIASYRADGGPSKTFVDPYTASKEGGYSTKEGESSIYLLRLEDVSGKSREVGDPRVDLVRAKAALVRALDLPAGRYMHAIKLTDGKFKRVQKV